MARVRCDVAVIGAGVVGLAIARKFALAGRDTICLEKNRTFGSETSSRNSEVIHAGLYYPEKSLKAELCARGRELLYEYCYRKGVRALPIGKYVVATRAEELAALHSLFERGRQNGADEIKLLSTRQLRAARGALKCVGILESPRSGILDSHSLMVSLLADFERDGGVLALRTPALNCYAGASHVIVDIGGGDNVEAQIVINSAGHGAHQLLPSHIKLAYTTAYAKGSYFSYAAGVPFKRLIYPVPGPDGLGIHLTLDLGGKARFGPDFEWISDIDYQVHGEAKDAFFEQISKYWPSCAREKLNPDYAGVRPKVYQDGGPVKDFVFIEDGLSHGCKIIHLLGIDSPGLTCCLSIAEKIYECFS